MSNDYITSKDLAKEALTGVARLEEERLEEEVNKEIWSALHPATQHPNPEWDEFLIEKKKKEKEPKRKKK